MKENEQKLYASPKVKVVEILSRRTLCGSPNENGLQQFDRENWEE